MCSSIFCSASLWQTFLFVGDVKAELSDKNLQLKNEVPDHVVCKQRSQLAEPFLLFLMFYFTGFLSSDRRN